MEKAVKKNCILFLKAAKDAETVDNDPYVKVFSDTGYHAFCISPINFKYHNLDLLYAALVAPSSYSGLILSSPRVVQALAESLQVHDTNSEWNAKYREKWRLKAVFAIGKATSSAAVRHLSLSSTGENSGNAINLIPEIIRVVGSQTLPILFPCGNLRRETIPECLAKEDITLHSLTVYDTIPDPKIEENLNRLIDSDSVPAYCVYFSPSGVYNTHSIMRRLGYPMDSQIKFIAIGPTTEKALLEIGLPIAAVAEKPTPECVSDVIMSLKNTE